MSDFEMKRGDTYFIDHAVTSGGSPYNLTGKSLRFTAKRSAADADAAAVVAKTSGAGISLTDAVNGLCRTTISPADTAALAAVPQLLVWELQVMSGSDVFTVDDGTLLISPDVAVTAP